MVRDACFSKVMLTSCRFRASGALSGRDNIALPFCQRQTTAVGEFDLDWSLGDKEKFI